MAPRWTAIRRRARALRTTLLAAAPTASAAALVAGAFALEEVEIADFVPGDFLPEGLRARLEREAGLVYVSSRLDPAERTWVLAHELGHLTLHADPVLEDLAEGFGDNHRARMVAYSPREAKERQADAFAAEFICPADALRRRLIQRGERASDVARQLDIPLALVREQAIEALLEPPGGMSGVTRAVRVELDGEQARYVAWDEGALVVAGGPGTGKTTMVAARIRRLVDGTAPPASILALVADNAAAERLRDDLEASHPVVAGEAWIGTFATLAREVAAKFAGQLGLEQDAMVLDRVGERELLGQSHADDGAALRAIPHAELVGRAAAAIARDAALGARLRARFQHVLVDDLQAATAQDLQLLAGIAARGQDVWAVADPEQAIDGFRGADPMALRTFIELFDAASGTLGINRRSDKIITRVVVRLRSRITDPGKRLTRRLGIIPLVDAPSEREESLAVAAKVAMWRADGIPYASQAILARSHGHLKRLAPHLSAAGVPLLTLGEMRDRAEVKELLATAALIADHGCVGPRPAPGSDKPGGDAQRPTRHEGPPIGSAAAAAVGIVPETQPRPSIGGALFDWLFEQPRNLRRLAGNGDTPSERLSLVAIHHVLKVCEEQRAMGDDTVDGLRRRIASIGSLDQGTHYGDVSLTELGIDAVAVLTIHAARGREFDAVAICGLAKANRGAGLVRPARDDAFWAEARSFLVALSRARSRILLTHARTHGGRAVERLAPLALVADLLQMEASPAGPT